MHRLTRQHDTPFGAQLTEQGVRFRLWAPGREQVALYLEGEQHAPLLPMTAEGDGWFGLTVPHLGAGASITLRNGTTTFITRSTYCAAARQVAITPTMPARRCAICGAA